MSSDRKQKVVFAASIDAGVSTIVFGIPRPAWDYMADGRTHTFDLTSAGLPIRLIMFGEETAEKAMETMQKAMSQAGLAYLDERRRDFAIKNRPLFYGWYGEPGQTEPEYDPPHNAPCLYCGTPIHADDVRSISLMWTGPVYAKRSYFYRTHKTCAERVSHTADTASTSMDGFILDMIARNGD